MTDLQGQPRIAGPMLYEAVEFPDAGPARVQELGLILERVGQVGVGQATELVAAMNLQPGQPLLVGEIACVSAGPESNSRNTFSMSFQPSLRGQGEAPSPGAARIVRTTDYADGERQYAAIRQDDKGDLWRVSDTEPCAQPVERSAIHRLLQRATSEASGLSGDKKLLLLPRTLRAVGALLRQRMQPDMQPSVYLNLNYDTAMHPAERREHPHEQQISIRLHRETDGASGEFTLTMTHPDEFSDVTCAAQTTERGITTRWELSPLASTKSSGRRRQWQRTTTVTKAGQEGDYMPPKTESVRSAGDAVEFMCQQLGRLAASPVATT